MKTVLNEALDKWLDSDMSNSFAEEKLTRRAFIDKTTISAYDVAIWAFYAGWTARENNLIGED